MKKILLLSDTHGHIDDKIFYYMKQSDEVWHAGDIGKTEVLDEIEALKPLKAVFGNIDGYKVRQRTSEVLAFISEGVKVVITHIGGYPGNYNKNAKRLITEHKPKLFICGHSHILKIMHDNKKGHLHMNPGAAGKHGFHKFRTLLRFELNNGNIKNLEAIEIGQRSNLSNAVN